MRLVFLLPYKPDLIFSPMSSAADLAIWRHSKSYVSPIEGNLGPIRSSFAPISGLNPIKPGILRWSLMIIKSPTLKDSFKAPAAFVTMTPFNE